MLPAVPETNLLPLFDGKTQLCVIIHWAPLFINDRGERFGYPMSDSKLWLQHTHTVVQCSANIFLLFFFFPFRCLLLIPHAAWLSEAIWWRRDSSHTQLQICCGTLNRRQRGLVSGKKTLYLISLALFLGGINSHRKTISSSFSLMHLPSLFHTGVALKSYPVYRHSESIIFRSMQTFCLWDENSQYRTKREQTDDVSSPTYYSFVILARWL